MKPIISSLTERMRCPFQVREYGPFQRTDSVPSCFPLSSVLPAETYVRKTSHPSSTTSLAKLTDFLRAKPSYFAVAPTSSEPPYRQWPLTRSLEIPFWLTWGQVLYAHAFCLAPDSYWFLAWHTLRPWKLSYVSPKRQWTSSELQAITTQPLLWEP